MNQNNKNFKETQEKNLSNALSAKLTAENHKQLTEHLLISQVEKSLKGSFPPKIQSGFIAFAQTRRQIVVEFGDRLPNRKMILYSVRWCDGIWRCEADNQA